MEKLKKIFKDIRDDFRNYVPPLTTTIDEPHHFETWAEFKDKKCFFGRVIMHADKVEVAFFGRFDKETRTDYIAGDDFQRTGDYYVYEFSDLNPELQSNIKESIKNLVDYFRSHRLLEVENSEGI